MTLVQKIGKSGSRAIFVLLILSSLLVTAFAQNVAPQNQGMRYGEAGFQGEPVNLNVVNADIRDILNYITEQYGVNFVIDKSVKQVPVTVNVSEVPWNVALDSILRAQELGVQVNGPILRISDQKSLAQERRVLEEIKESQLDSAPLYTEFIRLNYARALNNLANQGGRASGYQGGQTSANVSSGGMAGMAGQDQGVLGIVQKRLSRRGTVEVESRTNTLIITDVLENVRALRKLISYLDQPAPQVEIEARIVAATRGFSRDLGLKLSGVAIGNGGETVGGASTDYGSVVANTIVSLTTSALGTTQINAMLAAGEQKNQVKTIATPRITTLNNRPAEIESGSQIPVTTIQPNSGNAGVVVTTEYVPVPLRLAVTPQITNVGTIILNVVAENNTVPAISGDGAPPINTQRMQTEVMVPDGGTTVVGGALFDSESETVDRTPGLSRIPIFGNLFKRKRTSRDTSEILFFITPRIYRPDYNPAPKVDDDGALLVQPVPLGNPPSNSTPQPVQDQATRPQDALPADQPQTSEVQPATVKPNN